MKIKKVKESLSRVKLILKNNELDIRFSKIFNVMISKYFERKSKY